MTACRTPAADPLVDERRGERRLRCHGHVRHPPIFVQVWSACAMKGRRPLSTRRSTVTVRGSCWCTGSPRTATAGARSPPISPLDHEVLRVDAPGHGKSSEVRAGLSEGARLITVRGGGATYIGYSMGARFVLHAALANPSVVHGLVLVGGTGGIDEPEARAERRRADAALAHRLEHDGLEAFLDSWLAQPLFAGLPDAAQFREERGENTVDGLADSLRQAGTGSQEPLWPRSRRSTCRCW